MEWIWILSMVLEVVKMLTFGHFILEVKLKRFWVASILVGAYIGIMMVGILNKVNFSFIGGALGMMANGIMAELTFKNRVIYILKCGFLFLYLDIIVGKVLTVCVGGQLEGKDFAYPTINVIIILLIALIYGIKNFSKTRKYGQKSSLSAAMYSCVFFMGFVIVLSLAVLEYTGESLKNKRLQSWVEVLVIASLISVVSLFLFLAYMNEMRDRTQKYLETEQFLKQAQINYYELMLQREEETKHFRHDQSNHMVCLRELIQSNQKNEAIEYIEQLDRNMKTIQQRCFNVGNVVIDAMLNFYVQKLDETVCIQINGNCRENLSVNNMELCIIFSNLMKNAVEALERQKIGKKYLKVQINTAIREMKIIILNSMSEEEEKSDQNVLNSVKRNIKDHGIGLKNVKAVVEQCKGIFQWKKVEKEFQVVVVLPLTEEKAERS